MYFPMGSQGSENRHEVLAQKIVAGGGWLRWIDNVLGSQILLPTQSLYNVTNVIDAYRVFLSVTWKSGKHMYSQKAIGT